MPKGTTPHYQKKNGAMAEAWKRRKSAANASNTSKQLDQKYWRREMLGQRAYGPNWNSKNTAECKRLGIKLPSNITE